MDWERQREEWAHDLETKSQIPLCFQTNVEICGSSVPLQHSFGALFGVFPYDEDSPTWSPKNWRDWPSIQMNLDLGSDNVCMYHACERHFKLNSDLMGDFSHGPNRDQLLGLDDVSLKQFMQVHKMSNKQ